MSSRVKPLPGALLQSGDPLARGLAVAYLFNESTGVAAHNGTRSGLDLALKNAPSWVPGPFGSSLLFDGATQYSTVPGALLPQLGTPRTFYAVFRGTASGGQQKICGQWDDGAGGFDWLLYLDNGNSYAITLLTGIVGAGANFSTYVGPSLVTGVTYSVVVRNDPANQSAASLFVNGIAYARSSTFTTTVTAGPQLTVGAGSNNTSGDNYFTGSVDFVGIANGLIPIPLIPAFNADPFRPFRHRTVPVPLHPSSGGGSIVSVAGVDIGFGTATAPATVTLAAPASSSAVGTARAPSTIIAVVQAVTSAAGQAVAAASIIVSVAGLASGRCVVTVPAVVTSVVPGCSTGSSAANAPPSGAPVVVSIAGMAVGECMAWAPAGVVASVAGTSNSYSNCSILTQQLVGRYYTLFGNDLSAISLVGIDLSAVSIVGSTYE